MIKLCGEILSSREKAAKEIACVNENFAVQIISRAKKEENRRGKRKDEKSKENFL